MILRVVLLLGIVLMAGCRHVVVDPSRVASLNDADWVVKKEPAKK